jgi:hypothetical protein
MSLRQTYEKRLAKQREESLKIGQSLDNYKVEILTIRLKIFFSFFNLKLFLSLEKDMKKNFELKMN